MCASQPIFFFIFQRFFGSSSSHRDCACSCKNQSLLPKVVCPTFGSLVNVRNTILQLKFTAWDRKGSRSVVLLRLSVVLATLDQRNKCDYYCCVLLYRIKQQQFKIALVRATPTPHHFFDKKLFAQPLADHHGAARDTCQASPC